MPVSFCRFIDRPPDSLFFLLAIGTFTRFVTPRHVLQNVKANITHNWLSFHYLANPMHYFVFQRL